MAVSLQALKIGADKIEQINSTLTALDDAIALISAFTQTTANQDLIARLLDNIVDVKTIVGSVDLMQTTTDDIAKGSYLGNRKLDIDLALNKTGIASALTASAASAIWQDATTTVYYDRAVCTFNDGVVINVDFVNNGAAPIVVSTHGAIIDQLNKHTAFTAKLVNTSITEDVGGLSGTILRIVDVVGFASNLEKIELRATVGNYVDTMPAYYWAKTTSSLQTLASRIGELLAIAPNLTQLALLSGSITEMLQVQAKLTELTAIYTNLTELLNVSVYANTATTKASEASASATLASSNANLSTTKASEASTSASVAANKALEATQRADEIKGITAQATTLVAGSPASSSYNPVDGKFTFGIPQGPKGDRGAAFNVDASGPIAGRTAYDGGATGFSYLSLDEIPTQIYFKKSGVSGDWSAGVAFGKGDKGNTGLTGNGIASVARTAGNGSAGTTDTYTITFTDATTSSFSVTNGANGEVMQADLNTAIANATPYNYTSKSANYTAVAKDFIYADTSTASFTITLPLLPSANDRVAVVDNTSSFSTNPLTIARNGQTIMGLGQDMIVDTNNISFELIYNGTDWRII